MQQVTRCSPAFSAGVTGMEINEMDPDAPKMDWYMVKDNSVNMESRDQTAEENQDDLEEQPLKMKQTWIKENWKTLKIRRWSSCPGKLEQGMWDLQPATAEAWVELDQQGGWCNRVLV